MTDVAATLRQQRIHVHELKEAHEMNIGVNLQRVIWGYSELDTVPEQMFVVAKKSGGQVLAAFDGDKAIGFALAYAGSQGKTVYLHSHMVGVLPEYQDSGVGRLLKMAQRHDAMTRGFDLIEWTFDPLQMKNARFNIARLGAIVRRYLPNLYGYTNSALHAGLPTDRLVAEWWLRSARVEAILHGTSNATARVCQRITIPAGIRGLCKTDPKEAERIQSRVREQFQQYLANGLAAVGFEFDDKEGSYLLEPYED